MIEYLTLISQVSLAIWLGALLLPIIYKHFFLTKRPAATAFEITLLALCLLSFLHNAMELQIGALYGIDIFKHWVRVAWYFGFALTDFLLVIIVLMAIHHLHLKATYAVNGILAVVSLLGIAQIARYCDRYVFETDVLGYLIHNGVPAANTIMTILIVAEVLKCTVFSYMKAAKGKKC